MERSVALIRALVIWLNIAAWFLFFGMDSPRAPLALSIVITAGLYTLWNTLTQPWERYPILRLGIATIAVDVTLTSLWVMATGGPESDFWIIYLISVISVAMRYDLQQTITVAAIEAAILLGVLVIDGAGWESAILVRPGYVLIAGVAAGLLARQEGHEREERVHSERLAEMRQALLAKEQETVTRLRELDRLKTEFVAHASHELRTPLTTLSGLASTLASRANDLTPEQFARALESMQRQGERTRALIENLLDLSQLENGSLRMAVQPTSLTSALREALDIAPPPADHSVVVDVTDDARVLADRQRLGQVVTNLLVNAYHYGGPHIRWSTTEQDGALLLSISDDGDGVPVELEPNLFQAFRRGDNVGANTGSGLGLAISRRLVEAVGGDLWYERETPRGARFTIKLPRAS